MKEYMILKWKGCHCDSIMEMEMLKAVKLTNYSTSNDSLTVAVTNFAF